LSGYNIVSPANDSRTGCRISIIPCKSLPIGEIVQVKV
jgi:hypothetical protein